MNGPLTHRTAVTPGATAVIDADRGERLTVADLDAAVERMAGRLAALDVRSGDRLAVLLPTGRAAVEAVHAAIRLGAVTVPLGPQLPKSDLADRLDRAEVTAILCDATTERDAIAAAATAAVDESAVPVASVDDPEAGATALSGRTPEAVVPHDWALDSTLFVPFTSGTTGRPKGVRLTVGNVLASAVASAMRLGLDRAETWHVALPCHHVGGLTPLVRLPLYGMTVVIRESFDAAAVAADFETYDVTATSVVPTTLARLLDATDGSLGPSMRAVLLGGAPATGDLLDRCRDREVPIFPTYGMTETASQIATATPTEARAHPGTVGRPLFWTDLSVRSENGDERPPGEVGELVVSGPTVSPGYLGDDRSAFGPDGLHTGDVGYRDENGLVWVTGRTDDLILTGGENVAPATVVDAIVAHPDVADAAVVGLPDDEWGERVAALVVPHDEADLSAADIRSHCRDRLSGHELPRTIRFGDVVPRTDSGTVRRNAVRERLE